MGVKTFEATTANFQQEVLNSELPVLVDFTADWCPPCKMIAPYVEQIASEYEGKLRVAKLDTDNNPDVTMMYSVMSMPTLMLFKDGQPVVRMVGFQPKNRITDKLIPHLT